MERNTWESDNDQLSREIINLKNDIEDLSSSDIVQAIKTRTTFYKEYFDLEYQTSIADIPIVQKELLNEKTALVQYINIDSLSYVFVIEKSKIIKNVFFICVSFLLLPTLMYMVCCVF